MEEAIEYSKAQVMQNPQNTSSLNRLGCDYLFTKDWEAAVETFEQMLEIQGSNSTALYNLACAFSLQNKSEEALDYFSRSVAAGFTDVQHILTDTDLDNLRELQEFKAIVERLKAGEGKAAAGER